MSLPGCILFTGKKYTENNLEYIEVVDKFVEEFIENEPILLVEMGRVTQYDTKAKDNLMIVISR